MAKSKTVYTTSGERSGSCGHQHATGQAAQACIDKSGFSDRHVYAGDPRDSADPRWKGARGNPQMSRAAQSIPSEMLIRAANKLAGLSNHDWQVLISRWYRGTNIASKHSTGRWEILDGVLGLPLLVSKNAALDVGTDLITAEARRRATRPNPVSTGMKLLVGGLAVAGLAAVAISARATPTTPGPQPPSNDPPAPPPEHEVVITAPPAGSHPDTPPVVHHTPVNGSAPAPEPTHVIPPPPRTTTPPAPTTPPPVHGTPPHTGLVSRLSTSDSARQVFVFQALCYEWGMTGAVPDGLLGPTTHGLIRSVDIQAHVGVPSANFRGATTIRRLVEAMHGTPPPPRLLPFTLPRSVIAQVNATGTRIGSPILLQIHAT